MAKMSAQELMNSIRNKAKLGDNDFSKSQAIRLKAGKIKFQLIAQDSDILFRARTQHMIPTVPENDNPDEKWLVADCAGGDACPVCKAANAFKQSGVSIDDVNEAYNPKYPYKNLRAVFTQPEHYLLCAKVLVDKADEGSYLPKDSEIGSVHLIQFNKTALNNLMSAYEDFIEDNEDEENIPPLFAIFDDGEKTKSSLTITCRVTLQPYSCTFSFGNASEIELDDSAIEKVELLKEAKEVSEDHYNNCVKRIKEIQNYFIKPMPGFGGTHVAGVDDSEVPFDMEEPSEKKEEKKSSADEDDDLDIDGLL